MSFRNKGTQERKDNLEGVCSLNQLLLEYHTFAKSNDCNASIQQNCSQEFSWTEAVQVRVPELRLLSVQFSSVPQSCPTLCNPMDYSTPGLPVHHQLPEFTQTHVHWVSDAIQPSHPLSSPSPPSCLQYFPGSESFPMSQVFASGGRSIGDAATALVFPKNIQD